MIRHALYPCECQIIFFSKMAKKGIQYPMLRFHVIVKIIMLNHFFSHKIGREWGMIRHDACESQIMFFLTKMARRGIQYSMLRFHVIVKTITLNPVFLTK